MDETRRELSRIGANFGSMPHFAALAALRLTLGDRQRLAASPHLTVRCARFFDARTIERGRAYERQQRVTIRHSARDAIAASVRGSEPYTVLMRVESAVHEAGSTLRVNCSCPRFSDGYACKHLYALFCALDRDPRGFDVPAGRLQLARDDGFEEEDIGEEEDAPEGSEPVPEPDAPRPGHTAGADAALFGGVPPWLLRVRSAPTARAPTSGGELLYAISPLSAARGAPFGVRLLRRERKKDGAWAAPRAVSLQSWEADAAPEPDRAALRALAACPRFGYSSYYAAEVLGERTIPAGLQPLILPLLARTGRLCEIVDGAPRMLHFDETPLETRLRLSRDERTGLLLLAAELHGASGLEPSALRVVLESGLALSGDRFVRLADPERRALVEGFRAHGPIAVREAKVGALIERMAQDGFTGIEGLQDLGWTESTGAPSPLLTIRAPGRQTPAALFHAEISFEYGSERFRRADPRAAAVDHRGRSIVRRDAVLEAALAEEPLALGFAPLPPSIHPELGDVQLPRKRMPVLVAALIARGWRVDAQGVPVRRASAPRLSVRSGIDWFDLEGAIEFDGQRASLPELLAALERGESTVTLGDGSLGLLPEQWLARLAPLAELGEATESGVRFRASQALLLEALLASEPVVDADAAFRDACGRLARAGEPRVMAAPREFVGELRTYQESGLGWLHYLGEAGLGACLADDMGLGKTVQVLALLAGHYGAVGAASTSPHAPSLVVAPSSVVPNWLAEAARFAPTLRVLDFTGAERGALHDQLAEHDLVVTSYGTLRAEIANLASTRFHAVVLDEAQAIKNAAAKTAKAARLLHADRRIALSGTPVENHLGELWSLFDFLNPGLLGASARSVRVLDDLGGPGVAALGQALRPFILRRTKQQVLAELPAKTEQTLVCELEGPQRRLYDELLRHFRTRVLKEVDAKGLARSKIHVLEALLRLRQAACHPGLIDKARAGEGSAKLDLLLEQLEETLDEGHKALVFSQFTSLLAIVRARLDARGVTYEYLDGKTRDRAARVRRFQEDPACPLFLISLKAGGLGLNLTAADYVYLLDPWWNPAVESQAIDRAHRIGQTKAVFAYRLVAKDTIEEKILALQESKRRLADAVISADAGVLRGLTREDLELLLG